MRAMRKQRRTVSVFGSAAPRPGDETYELARSLGRRLAEAGWAVQTGAYGGVMEAVSRGAAEAGGYTIGVRARRIEAWRGDAGPNAWVAESLVFEEARERLVHLVTHCDAAIALPGGIGTLAELALAWNGLQTEELEPRPLVAVGALWARTVEAFADSPWIPPAQRALLVLADGVDDAVAALGADAL